MTTGQLLSAWTVDLVPSAGVVVAAARYLHAWRAQPHRPGRATGAGRGGLPRSRPLAFGLGLLASPSRSWAPLGVFSGSSFLAHMVEHLLPQLMAAPLLLLGGPHGVRHRWRTSTQPGA